MPASDSGFKIAARVSGRQLATLADVHSDQWTPMIVKTVAVDGTGVPELAAAIADYERFLSQQDRLLKKKAGNWRERLIEMLREALLERLLSERLSEAEIGRLAVEIAEHRRDPYSLVEEIVKGFANCEL